MPATMKPAKDLHKLDVGQPTAVCQLMVVPSLRRLVTLFRPAQGGPEDTEEGVLAMMVANSGPFRAEQKAPRSESWRTAWCHLCLFPRQAAWSNALLFSLVQPLAGYLVKSMRLIPTNIVTRPAKETMIAAAPT